MRSWQGYLKGGRKGGGGEAHERIKEEETSIPNGNVKLADDNNKPEDTEASVSDNCKYPITTIAMLNTPIENITFDKLHEMHHIIDGMHSNVCEAKLNKHTKVIIKLIKRETYNKQCAIAEFQLENQILQRLQ